MESVSAAEYGARPPSADVRDGTKTMPPACHPGPAHEGNDRIISGHGRLGDAKHIRSTAGTAPNPATTTAVAPLPTLRQLRVESRSSWLFEGMWGDIRVASTSN